MNWCFPPTYAWLLPVVNTGGEAIYWTNKASAFKLGAMARFSGTGTSIACLWCPSKISAPCPSMDTISTGFLKFLTRALVLICQFPGMFPMPPRDTVNILNMLECEHAWFRPSKSQNYLTDKGS